ncbi:MAG: hypothetical protein IPL28_22200 [Chloroflexi bacterium]|nr:hypothetical protein [Chloroflexota bacterium]
MDNKEALLEELHRIAEDAPLLDMDSLDQRLTFLEKQTGHCIDWSCSVAYVRPMNSNDMVALH